MAMFRDDTANISGFSLDSIDTPQSRRVDSKRRVHDTISGLNRNQLCPLIRFRGNGTGTGFCWEFREDSQTIILSKHALVQDAPTSSPAASH